MTAINYFQNYSQRENHVTNNTMLMLRHVYRTDPTLLEEVLHGLLGDDAVEIGARFEQQVNATYSKPDALLSQKSLNVYVEAKRGGDLFGDQLERHIMSIAENGHPDGSAFLVGLTKSDLARRDVNLWRSRAAERGVGFAALTYSDLLEALESACVGRQGIMEILGDFRAFIGGERLISDQYKTMVALASGNSLAENSEFGIYFEPPERNPKWAQAALLGLYSDKRVSFIGRITTVTVCLKVDGLITVVSEELGTITSEYKKRLLSLIEATEYYVGLGDDPIRCYFVDRFYETDLRKASRGGMLGHRYFDVEELSGLDLNSDTPTDEIASGLCGKSFV